MKRRQLKGKLGLCIESVRQRLSEARKNVDEDQKLASRTKFALDYLYSSEDMAHLISAVRSLGN